MRNFIFVICLFFSLWAHKGYATDTTGAKNNKKNIRVFQQTRHFESLQGVTESFHIAPDPLVSTLDTNTLTEQTRQYMQRARNCLAQIRSSQAYATVLDLSQAGGIPVGIKKTIGNIDYIITVDSLLFIKGKTYIVAYLIIKNPRDDSELYFLARNIEINESGGFTGAARLELMIDYSFNLGGNPQSGTTQVRFKKQGTYAEWDCNGFRSLGVNAEVVFSRDLLVVERPDGSIDSTKQVKGAFKAQGEDFNTLIATVNFDTPFQARKLKGVGFLVKEATFDLSETQNPASLSFPENYFSDDSEILLWEGVHIRRAEVRLPVQFKKKDANGVVSNDRLTFLLENVIIDRQGFTGKASVSYLMGLREGDMNRWSYSIDSLGIKLFKNRVVSAGFAGNLVVPITKETETLRYKCIIDPENQEYILSATTQSTVSFPLWQAGKVELYDGSTVEVKVSKDKFMPRAILNGRMTIEAGLNSDKVVISDKQKVRLADIGFEGLEVRSYAPYIVVRHFSFGSDVNQLKVAGFPVALKNISAKNYKNGIALETDLVVNFVGGADATNSFGAQAHLIILGEPADTTKTLSYRFKGVQVSNVTIDIDQGAFALKGELAFFKEDPTFGNGFQGNLQARFPAVEKIRAAAIFGTTEEGMRYWFADAMVVLANGIPVGGAVAIKGFGGGAYYQMKQAVQASATGLGMTPSGVAYLPDKNTGFGLRASIAISTAGSEQAFNGSVTLEVAFFKTGGVSRVVLAGEGNFVTPPLKLDLEKIKEKARAVAQQAQKLEEAMGKIPGVNFDRGAVERINEQIYKIDAANDAQGAVRATVLIDFDVASRTLHGNFKVYINVAGGLIKGVNSGDGLAGEAVMHVAPGKWYIHLGNPSQRIGLQLVGLAKAGAYFMVGDEIPEIPPPPAILGDILGKMDLSMSRNMGELSQGKGFALGMDISVDTGDLTFLMFYARFAAGLGFDIMVKNYGEDAVCEETQQRIGFNGWYAMGQAYAYVMGKIGIKVNLKFYKGKYDILDIAAAAILQAKLPNPSWFKGIVGGRFNILGGLVKGNCKFEVTIGKQCTIRDANILAGIEVIAQLTPDEGSEKLDVFTTPQAVFNYEIGKEFTINDPELNIPRIFRVKLDKFEVQHNGGGLVGNLEWDADRKTAAFRSKDVLPGESSLKAVCKISFEENVRGAWVPVTVSGNVITEEKFVSFTTDKEPPYIPLHNVAYSYPVINQLYLYKDEVKHGYIKLIQGQPNLFTPGDEWNQEVRLTSSASVLKAGLAYDNANNEVKFSLPEGMTNTTIYHWEIVNTPAYENEAINSNVSTVITRTGNEDNNTEITTQKATGSLQQLQEKSIFGAYFATSRYNRFIDKFNRLTINPAGTWPLYVGVHELSATISSDELFDKAELLDPAHPDAGALIQMEAEGNTGWHTLMLNPLIYNGISSSPFKIENRDVKVLGIPPLRDVALKQMQSELALSSTDASAGVIPTGPTSGAILYGMALSSYYDYTDLRTQASQVLQPNLTAWMRGLIETAYPSLQPGNYPVNVRYVLPGKNIITSQIRIIMNRP